jgi:hypothetical protein
MIDGALRFLFHTFVFAHVWINPPVSEMITFLVWRDAAPNMLYKVSMRVEEQSKSL